MEQNVSSVKEHTEENKIDNRIVYNILDQICKDTDLYAHVKQHKSNRDGRGAIHTIHSRWLGPNHVNTTTTEVEAALQMLTYDGETKASN